jgi:hypothetical protein
MVDRFVRPLLPAGYRLDLSRAFFGRAVDRRSRSTGGVDSYFCRNMKLRHAASTI